MLFLDETALPQIRGEQKLKVPHSRITLRRYAKRYPLGRGVARLGGFRGRVRKSYIFKGIRT